MSKKKPKPVARSVNKVLLMEDAEILIGEMLCALLDARNVLKLQNQGNCLASVLDAIDSAEAFFNGLDE